MGKKKMTFILFLVVMTASAMLLQSFPAFGSTPEERIDSSIKMLDEMSKQNDAASMGQYIKEGIGVALYPSVFKTGFGFGTKRGKGLILKRDPAAGKWYGPSFSDVLGASWGVQFGVQLISLVLVINNERGMEPFTRGDNVTIGTDLGVAAGPVGRTAGAATDIQAKAAIYSYSMSKGIFAGLSLEGATLRIDQNANTAYWGKATPPKEALSKEATDERVKPLIQKLEELIKKAE